MNYFGYGHILCVDQCYLRNNKLTYFMQQRSSSEVNSHSTTAETPNL